MNLDFLIEMGWKSALIAGAALTIAALMRNRAAADRAAVLKLAVALLLATPVVAVALPALEIEAPPAAATSQTAGFHLSDPMIQSPEVPARWAAAEPDYAGGESLTLPDIAQLVIGAYAGGLLLVLMRLLAGLMTLGRWARRAEPALSSEWTDALARAAIPGRPMPRLLVSRDAPAPMSWGLLRPVILIDRRSAARPEDADAIVSHEMAHIARRDWLSLLMARTAVALFWFNPLVWLLERDMFQQVEEAADASALGHVEPALYAQTLVSCAHRQGGAHVPANSMAASGLKRRVSAVLEARLTPAGSRWTLAAMIGCIAFAAPVAAVKLVEPELPEAPAQPREQAGAATDRLALAAAPARPAAPRHADLPAPAVAPSAPSVSHALLVDHAAPEPTPPIAPVAAAIPAHPVQPAQPPRPAAPVHVVVRPAMPRVPVMSPADANALKREIRTAIAQSTRASVRIDEIAEAAAASAVATVNAVAAGHSGMEEGARGLEQGARKMEHGAAQLRSRSYREKLIQRERARGRTVTHEELIEAGEDLADGARDLREGAAELREAAREMRRPI